MHKVSANYTLPTVLNTLKPAATSGLKKAVSAKASTAATTGTTSLRQQYGQWVGQHLPEPSGDGIAESGSHGSSGFDSDGRPDDLAEPAGPAHQHQSDRHRVYRHRNDGVGATSGGDGQRCCALVGEWRRPQHPFTFGGRCSSQPTAVRPQYDDAPKFRQCRRGSGLHQLFHQSRVYGLFQYQQQYLRR